MRETPPTEWEDDGIIEKIKTWFGRRHVNEQYVQIVYSDRKFERVAGPHYFWLQGGEQLGKTIYLGLRFAKLDFNGLSSIEPVRVGLKVSISYRFDPRKIGGENPQNPKAVHELTSALVHLPDSSFHKIIEGAALPLFRRIVPTYRISEIQRGTVFDDIEAQVKRELSANASLKHYGILMGNVQIEDRMLPAAVDEHLVRSAGTHILRDDLQKAGSAELTLVTLLKLLENTSAAGGENYFSTSELASNLTALVGQTTPPTRVVDSIPASHSPPAAPSSPKSTDAPEPSTFYTPDSDKRDDEESFGD